jgi:hypothetical protein
VGRPSKYPPEFRREAVERCTPVRTATSTTSMPPNTARTASRRCSTTDKTTRANPGLPQSGTPHGDVPTQVADPTPDAHHLTDLCRTSADGAHWLHRLRGERFLYSVKAPGWRRARSGPAPLGGFAAGGPGLCAKVE